MNAVIEGDIQICISVPLNYTKNNGTYEFLEFIFSNNFTPQINLPAKRNFSDNLTQMQNRFSWHKQLQKKYLSWCKPSVLIKALDLTAYSHQSWRKLRMISNSFENGIFPNLLKSAKVIPVFKNWFRLSCKNYRPIFLLSSVVKIIEKLIHKSLNYFLE